MLEGGLGSSQDGSGNTPDAPSLIRAASSCPGVQLTQAFGMWHPS